MILYKIQYDFQQIVFSVILKRNIKFDFIVLANYPLVLGIMSETELKLDYIKLQIRNKYMIMKIKKEEDKFNVLKLKIINYQRSNFNFVNFVGQISNNNELYINKNWRYAEKFKTQ